MLLIQLKGKSINKPMLESGIDATNFDILKEEQMALALPSPP
jgi:hypothetical protein